MTKKIAIATFTFLPETNGVSLATYNLANSLDIDNNDITIITKKNINRKSSKFNFAEFDIKGQGTLRNPYTGEVQEYLTFLKTSRFDIIYFICWQAWVTDLALPILKEIKYVKVLVSHGVSNHQIASLNIKRIFNGLTWHSYFSKLPGYLQHFNHLIFLSNKSDTDRMFDKKLATSLGLSNISVIPNCTSLQTLINFNIVKTHYQNLLEQVSKRFEYIILNVSNYEKIKNQKLSLDSFLESGIDRSLLVFIGSEYNQTSAELMTHYHKLKRRGSYPGTVLFLENISREEIYAYYLISNLFLLTSKSEVQPIVLIDALYTKLHAISTDVGCVKEMGDVRIQSRKNEIIKQILELNKKHSSDNKNIQTVDIKDQTDHSYSKEAFNTKHKELFYTLLNEK